MFVRLSVDVDIEFIGVWRFEKRSSVVHQVFHVQRNVFERLHTFPLYHIKVRRISLSEVKILRVLDTVERKRDRGQSTLVKTFDFCGMLAFVRKQLVNQMTVWKHNRWQLVVAAELSVFLAVHVVCI